MPIEVKVEGLEEIARKFNATREVVQRAIDRTAVDTEALVLDGAGQHAGKNGMLQKSVFKERVQGGWEIGHDEQLAPYARFVHDGAKPHLIRPRERKLLRWPIPGGYAFAKKVDHPGYKGDAWLQRAAREAPLIFERHVQALMANEK